MTRAGYSLRGRLLGWIILPIALFIAFDTVSLYQRALDAITLAYDRTLLSSARTIGELLTVRDGALQVELPSNALEMLDNGDARMMYRVSGFNGEFLTGYPDFPGYTRTPPQRSAYDALVDFYDGDFRGEPVRIAALYQPVAGPEARGVALVQVAETLEVRRRLARQILLETLSRQALLIAVVSLITWFVVAHALRPMEALRQQLESRSDHDLSPVTTPGLPGEMTPLVAAVNHLMQRLQRLHEHQRQFVRDASHQLRTPLAVMKTQVQAALAAPPGVDARSSLPAMHATVERAIRLANQMLALAKVEQVQADPGPGTAELAELAREVALDLSPLLGEKNVDFELQAEESLVQGHAWMVRELLRNLLHNAVRETPRGGALLVRVGSAELLVRDSGPGISDALRERLFEPFHTGHPSEGSGLGLSICREICRSLGASIELLNRVEDGRVAGLDARVRFQPALP